MTTVEIRQLTLLDDRSAFSSGHAALDQFFQKYAGQNQFRLRIGTTYVATSTIVRGLPAYRAPVLRLARFAVDRSAQGGGVGKDLIRFVLRLAVQMSSW